MFRKQVILPRASVAGGVSRPRSGAFVYIIISIYSCIRVADTSSPGGLAFMGIFGPTSFLLLAFGPG